VRKSSSLKLLPVSIAGDICCTLIRRESVMSCLLRTVAQVLGGDSSLGSTRGISVTAEKCIDNVSCKI
jgi:hypothetical protein